MHCRPQVYQSLLSQVIDVKYGCFTFPFSDCTQRQHERNIDLSKGAVKLLEPCKCLKTAPYMISDGDCLRADVSYFLCCMRKRK